jgi:hypothetical protein
MTVCTVFPGPSDALFFPEKCDLNSTCFLCAEGKYYFQAYTSIIQHLYREIVKFASKS